MNTTGNTTVTRNEDDMKIMKENFVIIRVSFDLRVFFFVSGVGFEF